MTTQPQTLVQALETVWPSKPQLKAVCLTTNREESYQALVQVCRTHGVDEEDLRQVIAQVMRAK